MVEPRNTTLICLLVYLLSNLIYFYFQVWPKQHFLILSLKKKKHFLILHKDLSNWIITPTLSIHHPFIMSKYSNPWNDDKTIYYYLFFWINKYFIFGQEQKNILYYIIKKSNIILNNFLSKKSFLRLYRFVSYVIWLQSNFGSLF